eukprot:GHVR01152053.1.p1 GENE.GHVR01152053.1~~GHVR01152053.1.p1  ORF type:complete len:205 (-),score=20.33 GHVR01152053.1:1100-1714(-)
MDYTSARPRDSVTGCTITCPRNLKNGLLIASISLGAELACTPTLGRASSSSNANELEQRFALMDGDNIISALVPTTFATVIRTPEVYAVRHAQGCYTWMRFGTEELIFHPSIAVLGDRTELLTAVGTQSIPKCDDNSVLFKSITKASLGDDINRNLRAPSELTDKPENLRKYVTSGTPVLGLHTRRMKPILFILLVPMFSRRYC